MDKWALVTGASGGIGKDISGLFAADKINLVITARNLEKLESNRDELIKLYGIKVEIYPCDLSLPESPDKLFSFIKNKSLNISYLVNNAGFGYFGDSIKPDYSLYEKMLCLNINALTHLTYLFAREMTDRKEGYILNISSTSAFQPVPTLNIYAATKAYVLNFGEAINAELKGTGVSVTTLCPGNTKTNFHRVAGFGTLRTSRIFWKDSKTVAGIGYKAMMKRKRLIVCGFFNKVLAFSVRFAPRFAVPGISEKMIKFTQK
jgi:uncharacterized protein